MATSTAGRCSGLCVRVWHEDLLTYLTGSSPRNGLTCHGTRQARLAYRPLAASSVRHLHPSSSQAARSLQIEEYKNAFKIFDRRKVGMFTADDVSWVMKMLGQKASPAELEAIIKDLDVDGDGVIDLAEFMVMMMSVGDAVRTTMPCCARRSAHFRQPVLQHSRCKTCWPTA